MASREDLKDLTIRPMKSADVPDAVRPSGEIFTDEPLNARANCKAKELAEYCNVLLDDIVDQNLTLVAETRGGALVGVLFSYDFTTQPTEQLNALVASNTHFTTYCSFIEHLEKQYYHYHGFTEDSFPRNHTVTLYMLGTKDEYRGMGVGSSLVAASLKRYREMGYRFVVTEATSDFTRRICDKLGFVTLVRILYADHFPAGSPYVGASDDVHTGVSLMMKELK